VLDDTLAFTTSATIASPPSPYAITPTGQRRRTCVITYDGVLTITPLPPLVPVPSAGDVAHADSALITATQRSVEAEAEVAAATERPLPRRTAVSALRSPPWRAIPSVSG
jgi:hypothetical protein